MKSAQNPDHTNLGTLISWLREGRYVIPDFQREFEWDPWDIRDLIRSIFLDYYIGSLLLWRGKKETFAALSCEPIYGFEGTSRPHSIVLDGQQRLTAMHYAFVAPRKPYPNRKGRALFWVRVDRFMTEQYDEAFVYDYEYDFSSERLEKFFADRETQFAEHIFPCAVMGAGGFELPNWLQGYEQYWQNRAAKAQESSQLAEAEEARQHAMNARAFGQHMAELMQQYQISYIELDEDLPIDKVCDIFTQLNSKGVRLDIFDLINALLKPKGLQLKHMWREAAERLAFVNAKHMNIYVLQVMSLMRQAVCTPKHLYFLLPGHEKPVRDPDGMRRKEILVRDAEDFERLWNDAVAALENAIRLLSHPQEFGAVASKFLPYESILPAFAALQAYAAACPADQRFSAQRKVRLWYWASVFTNRYSGSVESTSARDYQDVVQWIDGKTDEPALIQAFKNGFRNLDLRREVRRGWSIYNGVFNLLVLAGARDWITGNIPPYNDLDDHHIVPASWGLKHVGSLVHTILNRTPLTVETNRNVIGNKLPNEYLPRIIEQNGEVTVRATLESHYISPAALDILLRDPFTPADFEEFIEERRRTILDAIESLLIKERLDLPPQLRELDMEIEAVELGLRRLIDEALEGDAGLLPQHVTHKVTDRIQSAERKNAALDTQRYATLAGKLEFCDLRELQDIIVSKPLWPRFESRFMTKEALVVKFDQLANLRNGIRHSRTVDEITRKEGEAAIIWFKQVLAKE